MKKKVKGIFITLEGIDGVGKTTHLALIEKYIQSKGFKTFLTREPGGTEIGEGIRNLLLFNHNKINKITELLLMFASRQELIENIILPKLSDSYVVISDRFVDSSYAYQGGGRSIELKHISSLTCMLDGYLSPDLTILFDVDVNTVSQRINWSLNKDRIEKEDLQFFQRVRNIYLQLHAKNPERIKIISTEESIENTQLKVREVIDDLLIRMNYI